MKHTPIFLKNFFLCAGFLSVFCMRTAEASSGMVINEIMYDLPGSDDGREWVELQNESADPVMVATGTRGWRFYDGANHVLGALAQGSLTVPSGGFMVLSASTGAFLALHPGFSGTLIQSSFSLNNTSETLRLSDANGAVMDQLMYVSSWGANGNGKTLERKTDGSWRESISVGGTPGEANSPIPSPSPLSSKTQAPAQTQIPEPSFAPSLAPFSSPTKLPVPPLGVSSVPENTPSPDTADVVLPPYRSFFSRHALLLVLFAATASALGLVRWRRSR